MSEGWPCVCLGKVLRQRKEFIEISDFETYKRCRVQLHAQGVVLRDTVVGAEIKTKKQQVCRTGDLLVAEIDAKVGGFGIVPPELEGAIVSSHYFLFEVDESRLDRHFLGWFVRTNDFQEQVAAQGTTNYAAVRPTDVLGYRTPLPPLDEQQRVVAMIEELAIKVEEARTLQVEQGRQEGKLLLQSYRDAIEGAAWHSMAGVAPLVRRAVKVDPQEEYRELGIRSFGKGTFHKPPVPGAALGNKRVFAIEPGDLLFNIVFAWEGAVAVAQERDAGRVGSHRFLTCVPKATLATAEFLRFHFLTARGIDDLGAASPGGAGRNRTLGLKALAEIRVPVPPIEKQLWFNGLQAKVSALHKIREEDRAQWNALLPSIVARAFAGQL